MAIAKGFLVWLLLWQIWGVDAAELRPTGAQVRHSAIRYERGQGVKIDYGKAFRLYCLASAMGDREAQYHLGWMYFNGRGVVRNKAIAMYWFRHAARHGDHYALRMLRRFRGIRPLRDASCPLTSDPARMDKNAVVAWAKILGREFGVDARLVLAVIKQESSFNPSALSPKAAYGLMQLMPETAHRFAVNRLNPVENMIGGVLYLRWLLQHFKGDVRLVLAAYNAGEKTVHRFRGVPPYQETRLYVKRILGDYRKLQHPVPEPLPI